MGRECFTRSRSRSKHRRYGSGIFGPARLPAPTGQGRPRSQRGGELGLTLLTGAQPTADVRTAPSWAQADRRPPDGTEVGEVEPTGDGGFGPGWVAMVRRVMAGCDSYAVVAGPPAPSAAWAAASRASGTRYGEHDT